MTNDDSAAAAAVPPTTPSPPSSSPTTTTSPSPSLSSKLRKKLSLLLILPYLIGILWSTLHPIVSVVTGETKCRGSFIDENGLDPNQYRTPSYPTTTIERRASISTGGGDDGLCDSLWSSGSSNSRQCLKLDNMEVAKIIPPSSPVVPVEAVVLIVNAPPTGKSWRTNDFHMALLTLMERLGDVEMCPWLAKTVFVVTPKIMDGGAASVVVNLEEIVMEFLDGYLGVGNTDGYYTRNMSSFPPSFTSELVRTILVLDVDEQTSTTTNQGSTSNKYYSELQILSQGKRGVLPNMDLVFATVSTFRNSIFNSNGKKGKLRMHPFGELEYWLEDKVEETVKSKEMKNYMLDMGGLLMFGVSMVLGPHPPHAPILDRGIDSLTITARYPPAGISSSVRSSNNNLYATEFVRSIEQLLRSLSNLHERLHHSITQYLLPSPTKFVSNNEYIFPIILLMLPLVIRAIFLVFVDMDRFCFRIALSTMGICIGVSICFLTINAFVMEAAVPVMNSMYGIGYVVALSALHRQTTTTAKEEEKELSHKQKGTQKQSVQFVGCILAIYMHVPIALCHVTLAFPSALLWTPLLAFPSYYDKRRQHDVARIIGGVILLIMWPPFFLVPIVMGQYTTYVLMVYTPLHLLLTSLWLL